MNILFYPLGGFDREITGIIAAILNLKKLFSECFIDKDGCHFFLCVKGWLSLFDDLRIYFICGNGNLFVLREKYYLITNTF